MTPLILAALRLVADAPSNGHYRKKPDYERTLIKRSLIEDLRREFDAAGLGDDWRTLHKLIREEERTPRKAAS